MSIEEPGAPIADDDPATAEPAGRRFRFGRGDRKDSSRGKERGRSSESASSAAAGSVSPMDFWRSGSPRAYKPAQAAAAKGPRWLRPITNFYLPPWAPVVGIIVVVFGILGFLFIVRSATGSPRIGDHWHAPYQFFACGQKQPNAGVWESGVHTHADGIMHIHPFQTFEEGSGAAMVKWFEYGGGKLTNTSIKLPQSSVREWKNGDLCPDGKPGELQVYVTKTGATSEERLRGKALTRFIPHDGDRIRIVFGPPEEIIQAEDRTVIPGEQATRTVDVTVTDDGTEAGTKFEPNSIEVTQGEVVKLVVKNAGKISHGFRVSGADKTYDNTDDFLVTPDGEDPKNTAGILQPGAQGSVVMRLDIVEEVEFHDSTTVATGTIVVRKGEEATPSPTPKNEEQVDVEFGLTTTEFAFSQTQFTVKAGQKFRFNLTNSGTLAHSLRIAGPDGEFNTDDDLVSVPHDVLPGATAELAGQIDKAGTYAFRDDFNQTVMTGTLVVE